MKFILKNLSTGVFYYVDLFGMKIYILLPLPMRLKSNVA